MQTDVISFFTGKKVSINTTLEQQSITAGDLLRGKIIFTNQTANETLLQNIAITFIASYQRPINVSIDKENTLIFRALLQQKLILYANETCEMPFQFPVPLYMPTLPASAIVKTNAKISILQTISDTDEVIILPHPKIKELFDIFWELGFKHTALSGYVEKHLKQPLQIFSIKPIKEPYLGKLKDLEFFYVIDKQSVEIFMTMDKMTKELLGMGEEDDEKKNSKIRFKIMLNQPITPTLISYYMDKLLQIAK